MIETRLARAVLVTVVALTLSSCAATPPGKLLPIVDAKSVAGKWAGTIRTEMGRLLDGFMTITETGMDKGAIENFVNGQLFTATFRIKDGKGETEAADGRLGTMTLYERGGKQVLSTYTEPGLWGELTRTP